MSARNRDDVYTHRARHFDVVRRVADHYRPFRVDFGVVFQPLFRDVRFARGIYIVVCDYVVEKFQRVDFVKPPYKVVFLGRGQHYLPYPVALKRTEYV